MKKNCKLFVIFTLLITFSTFAFANKLDDWLDKYEEFIVKVEQAAKDGANDKSKEFNAEKDKIIKEKEQLQKKEGKFSFLQSTRYGLLNSRYGIAIGAMKASKGIKDAADELDKQLDSKKEEDVGKGKTA